MSIEQMTNEADGETIRATKDDDGVIVIESAACDDDGQEQPWAVWQQVATRYPDGRIEADVPPEQWTEARTATVNDVLRLL
jgi:hypothetical protein